MPESFTKRNSLFEALFVKVITLATTISVPMAALVSYPNIFDCRFVKTTSLDFVA